MPTNNITRLLDSHKIAYIAFELPAEKIGALQTAKILNVPPEQVFKTIVVTQEKPGKPILAVIPGTSEADLKLVAKALGVKKVSLPTQNEAERLTGLLAGGISPLALINRGFVVLLDDSARSFDQIHISGGQRGINIRLPVTALVELTHARFAIINRPLENSELLDD